MLDVVLSKTQKVRAEVRRTPPADLTALVLVVGFGVAFIVAYARYFYVKGTGFPEFYSFFAVDPPGPFQFPPGESVALGTHFFGDFLYYWVLAGFENPWLPPDGNLPSVYLPIGIFLSLRWTDLSYVYCVLIVIGGSFLGLIFSVAAFLGNLPWVRRATTAFAIVVFSSPVLVCLDRGSMTIVLALLVVTAMLFARSGRWTICALLIALAASVKVLPILFVFVLLAHRQYRATIITVLLASGLSTLPFLAFGGIYSNIHYFTQNVRILEATTPGGIYNRSLKGFAESAGIVFPQLRVVASVVAENSTALMGVLVVSLLLGALILRASVTPFEASFFAFAVIYLTPHVTYSYVEVFALVPLMLLLDSQVISEPFQRIFALLLALLLVPKNFEMLDSSVSISQLVNPFLVLTMLAMCCGVVATRRFLDSSVDSRGQSVPAGPAVVTQNSAV